MNPLTLVKRIQNINSREAQLGISEEASWHAKYKDSAYVYVGGIPFELTEGDLVAVFAQYGEVVDVNLVRDKGTGKSKGFSFIAYEDQRSTVLAVDNLNGAQILGRTIRVDHVTKYKKKEEEDEEEEQRKREERGVCRAFQRGECTRGAGCRFSHNEQRAANTGWGDQDSKWGRDRYDGPKQGENRSNTTPSNRVPEAEVQEDLHSRGKGYGRAFKSHPKQSYGREETRLGRHEDDERFELRSRDHGRGEEKRPRRPSEDDELGQNSREDYGRREKQRLGRQNGHELQPKSREDHDRREDKRPRRQGGDVEFEPKLKSRDDHDRREDDRREDRRARRRSDDGEFEPKSREDRDRRVDDSREDKRLRRHAGDDEFDPKSKDHDRTEERRRYADDEYQPKSREDRWEEQRSRRRNVDEFELKSRTGEDKRKGERLRRYEDDEFQPKSREVKPRLTRHGFEPRCKKN
ncbi:unnamed protein product [Prunus armeniaca]